MFCATIVGRFNCFELNYQIMFNSCSCKLSYKEKKQVIRKHKSSAGRAPMAKTERPEQMCQLLSKMLKRKSIWIHEEKSESFQTMLKSIEYGPKE